MPPGERRQLSAAPDAAPAQPAAAGHFVHPAAGPRPPDRGDFDLYPGGLWLQRAAVPARHAGRIYAAKAGCPPHQMIFAENAFLFARFLLY